MLSDAETLSETLDTLRSDNMKLNSELGSMTDIRDGFRKRYLEEREARKDLERDVRRVKKECKA